MIRQDYILRMIDNAAKSLANILFKRDEKLYEESNEEVSVQLKSLMGMDLSLLFNFSEVDMLSLIQRSSIDKQYAIVLFLIESSINFREMELQTKYQKIKRIVIGLYDGFKNDIPEDINNELYKKLETHQLV